MKGLKLVKKFNYDINFKGTMNLTVVANSKEEADRILKDTIDSITDERFKSLFSELENVEIRAVDFRTNVEKNKDKNRGDAR